MKNYQFKLCIKPDEIYNKILPEQRDCFDSVKITQANLLDNGTVELTCLALKDEIIETSYRQLLSLDTNKTTYINVVDL